MTIVQWLLLPAFIHVGWIYLIAVRMGMAKNRAMREGSVKLTDVAVDNSRWPDDVRKINNNYNNQFELPVLFYAILPLLIILVKGDWLQVTLAWVFVASRILHSQIHTGSNTVPARGLAFVLGFIAVGLMWLWFALRLFVIG
jgi:hypothetical protein